MQFQVGTILAIAQAILTTVAMQPNPTNSTSSINSTTGSANVYGCFKSGELWKDLGTNKNILDAYENQWCKLGVGTWALGSKSSRCIRGDPIKHAFKWEWTITKIPDGKDRGYVSHDVCLGFLPQVLDLCEKGGILDLMSGPGTDGGDIIGVNVMADPQGSLSCYD